MSMPDDWPQIAPFRRVPLRIQVGQHPVQQVGYIDSKALAADSDAALIDALRRAANNLEADIQRERANGREVNQDE